jgi:hypothetical protein
MISVLKESLLVFVDSLDKPNSNYGGSKTPPFANAWVSMNWTPGSNPI